MNKTLEQILLDWIGNNKQNAEVSEYYSGYNQSLSDLRARVPKLVEKIEKLIDEKVGNATEDYNECNY